jgi:nicotinate-nucleotide adenylyltransferase
VSTPAAHPGSARPGDAARPRRIGLFGGSFDPVHLGHLHVAEAAERAFALDRIVFVPAAQPPHKPGRQLAPGEHRVRMLALALAGRPGWSVSELELARGGTSWTIDTVRALPREIGEADDVAIYLLIGDDNLPGLPQWREARALVERVQPVVVRRDGDAAALLEPARRALGDELARKIERGYLALEPVRVSSTELRVELPGLASDARGLPPAVLAYIRAHGLYGSVR